ncbi:hypothetical protein VTN77DRAFT_7285 [Rasamsonia byssochlamydoides]|uniref:uncharacterized protein n=1 Tax=Rasamsonia byssochlamydoides TaxID=89139 RepID=UPI003742C3F0
MTFALGTTLAIGALASVIIYWPCSMIYNLFFHPLASVPGPRLYAMSQIPYLHHMIAGKWPFVLAKLHDKYGPIVRIAPSDVSFISATAWNDIHGHRTHGKLPFEKDTRIFAPTLTDTPHVIKAKSGDHARMRRLLAHAFSEKALRGQEGIIQYYIGLLISKLREHAAAGGNIDLVKWYNYTTLDIIGHLSFGKSFGCLVQSKYHLGVGMVFATIRIIPYLQVLYRMPFLKQLTNLNQLAKVATLARYLVPERYLRDAMELPSLGFTATRKRIETGNLEGEDFVSYMLRHNDEKKGMTIDEMGENATVFIIAGSETTATLLSGATFYMLKNPLVYKRVVEEVRSTFNKEEDITMVGVNRLPYMMAVLRETLRLYPPVPTALPRIVPEGGAMIDGYFIPENTSVGLSHLPAYTSARNFSRPDEFLPERWLNDPRFASDIQEAHQPFGLGSRVCLGKKSAAAFPFLAYAEMKLIMARTLWNFDLELEPDSKGWNKQNVYLLWEKKPLNIKLTPVVK